MFYNKENLNNAFKELRKLGYFARQNFKCCQSCAWAAVPMDKAKVGFRISDLVASPIQKGLSLREVFLYW